MARPPPLLVGFLLLLFPESLRWSGIGYKAYCPPNTFALASLLYHAVHLIHKHLDGYTCG